MHGRAGKDCYQRLTRAIKRNNHSLIVAATLTRTVAAGKRAEEILGRKLRSNFVDAGPVPHQGIRYDKEKGIL